MATGCKMISMKKLPVGYRLNPSDEDLVNHHLKRKLLNTVEQYCLIPEFDIYKHPPWDLITKFNELSDLASDGGECFFYHRRGNGKRISRKTKEIEGFWKVTGQGRKPLETDRTKWLKRILVYHVGKQKSSAKSEWAMHEYENLSDKSVVACRIHKIKAKKGKEKVDSVSSEAGSNGSPRGPACSDMQIEPQETSPQASVNTTVESHNPTLTSNTNVSEISMTSLQHETQIVAEERLSPSEDTYANSMQLADLNDPEDPRILVREQSPCSENTFTNGCDQADGSWSRHGDVILEGGGSMFIFDQTPTDQSPYYELPEFTYSPQQPCFTPTEETYPLIGNTSFNGTASGMVYAQLDIHGAYETNFKEGQQSILNSPTPIATNSDLSFPEELQMLRELSSIDNTHPSSDSSGGGSLLAFHFGQSYESQQTNVEVTRGSASDLPAPTQSSDVESWLDSFFAHSPPPYASGC